MASTVGFIESARSGMNAAQMGLQITRQNITNADTKGYTRQSLNQSAISPDSGSYRFLSTAQKAGQGVSVDSVYQIRNEFLDVRYRQAYSGYKFYSGMQSQLSEIEDQFNEFSEKTTDQKTLTGLSGMLDSIATAIKEYQNGTSDTSISKIIQSNVDYLASSINTDAKFLDQTLDSELKELNIYVNGGTGDTSETNDVSGIDGIIETVQSLNSQIQSYEITGQKANELRDQRNVLLDELSSYVDITTTETPQGIVSIQLQSDSDSGSGKYIINQENVANEFNVTTNADAATGKTYTVLKWGKTVKADGTVQDPPLYKDQMANVEGGLVKSYLNVINGDGTGVNDPATGRNGGMGILYLKSKLNDFAKSFANAVNDTYRAFNTDGSYSPLVTFDAANPAKTISISNVWRAVPETFVKGVKTSETDMSNYLTAFFNKLFNDKGSTVSVTSLAGGADTMFSGTISSFADTFTAEISSSLSVIGDKADSFKTTSSNLDDQRQSISSVSVNDEGVNLIKYQQAYNASARVITAIDQMLDKLINGTGTVGLS